MVAQGVGQIDAEPLAGLGVVLQILLQGRGNVNRLAAQDGGLPRLIVNEPRP